MPWYKSEALTILALFIFPPAGVVLAWLQRWDPIVKAVASLLSLSGSLVLLLVLANTGSPSPQVAAGPQPARAAQAAPAKPAGALPPAQASTAPAANQAVPPQGIPANTQAGDDLNPKNVFSRAFSGLGGAIKNLVGDVTSPPSAPPIPGSDAAANPQPSGLIRSQTGASQPSQAAPASKPATAPQPAAAAAKPSAPAAAPVTGQALTAAQKKDIQDTLNASVAHYSSLLDSGKAALGTKRYEDAAAVAEAIDQPGTPAANFNKWRDESGVDGDTTFEDAYDKASTVYASAGLDIPAALDTWLTDMTEVQGALVDWADAATDWQGSDKTDAELAAVEKTVRDGLAKAKADLQGI
jgi:hypothetical protein